MLKIKRIYLFVKFQKQSIELRQLKQTITDELQKVKAGVTLDLSLERSRAKEDVGPFFVMYSNTYFSMYIFYIIDLHFRLTARDVDLR